MPVSNSRAASNAILPNELFLDVVARRSSRTAHAPSTTRALALAVETDGGNETGIEFSEIMSYIHTMQCRFDPVASTHVHACCVITNARS